MSLESWQYAFTNEMPLEVQKSTYEALCAPESKLLIRDTMTDDAYVDYKAPHAPLLFTSGSIDNCIPAELNYTNFKKYTDTTSVTEYKELEGRNHFVLGQPSWKEDADYILNWLATNTGTGTTNEGRTATR